MSNTNRTRTMTAAWALALGLGLAGLVLPGCGGDQLSGPGSSQSDPSDPLAIPGGNEPTPQRGGAAGGETGGDVDSYDSETKDAVRAARAGEDGVEGADGVRQFVLDPTSNYPVVLRAPASAVGDLANGFELKGAIELVLAGGRTVLLAEAELKLTYSASGSGLDTVSGSCRLPIPDFGLFENVKYNDLIKASIGFDYGKNLKHLKAPLNAERRYLYFAYSASLGLSVGNVKISGPGGKASTMVLDPFDPFLYLKGDIISALPGVPGTAPIDDLGIGFSWQGLIPFTPKRTWGVEQQALPFKGHMWLEGGVSFAPKLPLQVKGQLLLDLDADDDGKSVFVDPAGGVQYGANADVAISLKPKKSPFGLTIPIGGSTTIVHVSKGQAWATYSGEIAPDKSWLPSWVPLHVDRSMKVAGYLHTDVTKSFLKAEGNTKLNPGALSAWTGLDMSQLAVSKTRLDVNHEGIRIKGTATSSFSPLIGLDGGATVEGFFSGDPSDWFLQMDGKLSVKGVALSAKAKARLDATGMAVEGTFATPLTNVTMKGSITKAGVDVRGKAQVEIPVVAGKELVQWVTDAAVCGYETVTDAAVCGVETVVSGAKCGYNTITSVAVCGTKTVTSAAECGTKTITSAAVCGTKTVTDGAICGWNTFTSIAECGAKCVGSLFSDCKCKKPATCKVAKSCKVAASCKIAASCKVEASCSVPKSCQRVKTCEKKVIIPDYDFGTFKGQVEVKIGDSGVSGEVSGQFCPKTGGCVTLTGGRLEMSSGSPEACIYVPIAKGEFCAKF